MATKPKQVNDRLFEVGSDFRVEEGLARAPAKSGEIAGRVKAGRIDPKSGEVLEAEQREWKVYQRRQLSEEEMQERGTIEPEAWDLVKAGFETHDEALAFVSKQEK